MNPRPVIFSSAVSSALKSARQRVANTLTFRGYEPAWQDLCGAGEGHLRARLRRRIDASAGGGALIGQPYGSEPLEGSASARPTSPAGDGDAQQRVPPPPPALQAQQPYREALGLAQRAEAGWRKVLGADHPDSQDAKALREQIEAELARDQKTAK